MDREDDDRAGGRRLALGRGAEKPHHDSALVGQGPRGSRLHQPAREPGTQPCTTPKSLSAPATSGRTAPARCISPRSPGGHRDFGTLHRRCTVDRSPRTRPLGPGTTRCSRRRSGARPCTGLTTTRHPADSCDSLCAFAFSSRPKLATCASRSPAPVSQWSPLSLSDFPGKGPKPLRRGTERRCRAPPAR
jgi:hypothetical protein